MNGSAFALSLYLAVVGQSGGKNVLISPYSVRQAVGMAYVGAHGQTRDDIGHALAAESVPGFVAEEKKTRQSLSSADPKVRLDIANSFWLNKNVRYRASFIAAARSGFAADAFQREFNPATLKELNSWVANATSGRIPGILDHFDPNDVAVLIDAVYFKGAWQHRFDKASTRPREFHPLNGPSFQHPMMTHTDSYDYYENAKVQAVRMPYGSGRLAMIAVLPSKDSNLADFHAHLDSAAWSGLRSGMRGRRGEVTFPRFRFDQSMELKSSLSALGMGIAFDQARADFQDMVESHIPIHISKVLQKTFIAVDEEGTEAAAATAVVMHGKGMMHAELPFRFVADRPFFFAIEDSQTGALLFVGSLQDPR
jgi:serpin B